MPTDDNDNEDEDDGRGVVRVQIVFAPLPEEDRDADSSAAREFADRTADAFRDSDSDTTSCCDVVETCHLAEWDKDAAFATASTRTTAVLLLVSCGPDGSVHRSVRKTTKWLKERSPTSSTTTTTTVAAVALLGGAVCKTSAEQMEDQIYASGRKLAKALKTIAANSNDGDGPSFRLETQIELEAPEEKFDGWVRSWVERLSFPRKTV